ncbi:hypothetical protein E0H26_11330 [Micromonospora zingiberis]|uniref:Uncharacterized protein n=1 Tax=Micromonospora zingiberis TaxID=2053011 RepID=A0A4R0GKY1_9ACTN|nr:hypothetical protein E0H26_11330 [Micromonospora zingiberis]
MRAHRTDLVSFAFGLLFLAFAAWWLLAQVLGLVLPPVGWFLASGLILIGVLGLVGALRSSRQAGKPEPPSADGTDTPDTASREAAGTADQSTSGGPQVPPGPDLGPDLDPAERTAELDLDLDRASGDDRTLDLTADGDPPGRRGPAA